MGLISWPDGLLVGREGEFAEGEEFGLAWAVCQAQYGILLQLKYGPKFSKTNQAFQTD